MVFRDWRSVIALVAILIVSGTIIYSRYLAQKIATEERQSVEQWVEAGKFLINSPSDADTKLASMILTQNTRIPIIETNENDSIIQYINLDSSRASENGNYLQRKLREFKLRNQPIEWINPLDSTQRNFYYYGDSILLKEVRYYPIIQLIIVGLFIIVTMLAVRSSYRSVQNQVWAGMAKETAHQLGTPVSSLEGWIEMLRQNPANAQIVAELEKDVNRLQLVSDRFGKIGSKPQLERKDVVAQIKNMVEYMRKRATGRVQFQVNSTSPEVQAMISGPLFDWVIENLLKNSLDSMEGKGSITINIKEKADVVAVDVTDTGKGIQKQNFARVFKPGFTTKKRGWGLGLSLSKRIIKQYHQGDIYVKNSEVGKGTTFRIVLMK